MIWVGGLLAVIGYAIGTVGEFTSKKMMDISASLAGQSPSSEQGAEMAAFQKRGTMLTKIASLLVLVAVAFIALAQHVQPNLKERSNWTSDLLSPESFTLFRDRFGWVRRSI